MEQLPAGSGRARIHLREYGAHVEIVPDAVSDHAVGRRGAHMIERDVFGAAGERCARAALAESLQGCSGQIAYGIVAYVRLPRFRAHARVRVSIVSVSG